MYYNYNDITPGLKCSNWEEVFYGINDILKGNDQFAKNRKMIKNTFHKFNDTNNCQRITEKIKELYE